MYLCLHIHTDEKACLEGHEVGLWKFYCFLFCIQLEYSLMMTLRYPDRKKKDKNIVTSESFYRMEKIFLVFGFVFLSFLFLSFYF
jgi:hypothetical protein